MLLNQQENFLTKDETIVCLYLLPTGSLFINALVYFLVISPDRFTSLTQIELRSI